VLIAETNSGMGGTESARGKKKGGGKGRVRVRSGMSRHLKVENTRFNKRKGSRKNSNRNTAMHRGLKVKKPTGGRKVKKTNNKKRQAQIGTPASGRRTKSQTGNRK